MPKTTGVQRGRRRRNLRAAPIPKRWQGLRAVWLRLEKKIVREEIISAFTKVIHPDGLKIAALGLDDAEADVRKSAASSVAFALGLSGTITPEEAKAQITARQGRTLEQAQEDRTKEIVAALRSAKSEAVPLLLDAPASTLWRSKRLRDLTARAGFFDAIRPYLLGDNATPATKRAVFNALYNFETPDSTLKDVMAAADRASDAHTQAEALNLLGRKRYRPAYDRLKQRLERDVAEAKDNSLRFRGADALAHYSANRS